MICQEDTKKSSRIGGFPRATCGLLPFLSRPFLQTASLRSGSKPENQQLAQFFVLRDGRRIEGNYEGKSIGLIMLLGSHGILWLSRPVPGFRSLHYN
jgi:hypothetical protein